MNKIIRTFLAVKIPEDIIACISRLQKDIQAYHLNVNPSYDLNVNWVKPENIHLTLKFLGNTHISDLKDICDAMQDVVSDFTPFLLSLKGAGVFPDLRRPRVIWVGLFQETDGLVFLQKQIDIRLENMGVNSKRQIFKGHVTIGRIKGRTDRTLLGEILYTHQQFCSKSFMVDSVYLLQSELKPTGPVYSKLMSFQL